MCSRSGALFVVFVMDMRCDPIVGATDSRWELRGLVMRGDGGWWDYLQFFPSR